MAKIRLVEKVLVSIPRENIEVYDKPILFESEGKIERKLGKLKNIPVTKYTENLNERVYPRELWKKVQESGAFEGSSCRADHPVEEGSVKDIVGVWGNFRVKEDVAVADLTVIGHNGNNMLDIVSAGGKLGFSTVGMGELQEDNKTVDPNSFEYENTDWVMVPSQGVFATAENLSEGVNITSNLKENITNNKISIIKENIEVNKTEEVNSMMDKIQELAFRNQINRTIRESLKKEDAMDAISELNELIIPEQMTEERTAVTNAISKLHEKMESSKKHFEEKAGKVEESYKEIKTKYDMQSKMLESMKEKFQKIDSILKSQGLESIKDIEIMKESIGDAIHDIKIMKEEKMNLLSDMKVVMAERVDMLKDIKVFIKRSKMTESEKTKMLKEMKKLKAEIKYNESYTAKLERLLKKEGYKIKEAEADDDEKKADEDKEEVKEEDNMYSDEDKKKAMRQEKKSALKRKVREEEDEDDAEDMEESDDEDDAEEKKESRKRKESKKKVIKKSTKGNFDHLREEDDEDDEDADEEDEDEEIEESADEDEDEKVKEADDSDEDEDKEEIEEADEDEEEKDKKDTKAEAAVRNQLKAFFGEQVKQFPGLKDYEKQILATNSFTEAVRKIERIKEKKQSGEQVKFSEAKINKTWIPVGRN